MLIDLLRTAVAVSFTDDEVARRGRHVAETLLSILREHLRGGLRWTGSPASRSNAQTSALLRDRYPTSCGQFARMNSR